MKSVWGPAERTVLGWGLATCQALSPRSLRLDPRPWLHFLGERVLGTRVGVASQAADRSDFVSWLPPHRSAPLRAQGLHCHAHAPPK